MDIEGFIIFPLPSSTILIAMSVVNLVSAVVAGIKEASGDNVGYSKFFKSQPKQPLILIPSKTGMLILYTPAFLRAFASLFFFQHHARRFLPLRLGLTLHYLKGPLEVMFVHKYSGSMALDAVKIIPLSYLLSAVLMIYAQHLSCELQQPKINLMFVGRAVFVGGLGGNLYHHYLLSTFKGAKESNIPRGGLFRLAACPHHLFEVVGFWGIAFIAQAAFSVSNAVATAAYLMGRSRATRKWYASKFEGFPDHVKAIIPYVF